MHDSPRPAARTDADLTIRAMDLFDGFADSPSKERARMLCALQSSDPSLHAELVRLLEADAIRDALLESPQKILSGCARPRGEGEVDSRLGARLGVWRIDALIGTGGMGRVYRASRADGQYAQVVAIKCVNTDIDSKVLADVIRNERDMLAMLEHPNIATLLDGGVDAEGRPWFAMQLVRGETIDRWCDQRRLDLRTRVALFVQLCDGLRYAHGKGALHSDLKPSNVLVDDDGRPVLVDFGLSSLTARSLDGTQRRVAMTFGYTAPEVPTTGYSVASDIYALGAMLCGLLCGAGPQYSGAMTAEPATPLLPSQYAKQGMDDAARTRGLPDAAALSRALSGDLDSVVAACLAHDPAKRPDSVARLQADLRAWLAFRPLSTQPQSTRYRLRLFLRRHRVAVAVAAAALVLAGIGIAASVRLYGQAVGHAESAQAMQRMFGHSFDALTSGGLGQSPLVAAATLHEVEARLRRSEVDGQMDAASAASMRMTLARSYTTLGDYRRAQNLLDEARARSDGHEAQQAPIQAALAHLLNIQSRHPQAYDAAEAGLAHIGTIPPMDREITRLMLEVELARAQWGMARLDEAGTTLRAALVRAEDMAERDPRPLAALLIQRGQWQQLFSRHEDAMADFERAARLATERAPILADDATVEQVQALNQIDQHARAVELARALLERRRRTLGEEHPETGRAWALLGNSHFWNGQVDSALECVQRGVELLSAALGEDHPETVRATLVRGTIHLHTRRPGEAVENARRALGIMEKVYGPNHRETMRAMGFLAAALAVTVPSRPDRDQAWQEVIDLFARRTEIGIRQGLPMLSERMVLIKAKMRVGQVDEQAQRELENIVAALTEARGASNDSVHNARFTLVEAYLKLGKEDLGKSTLEAMLHDLSASPATLVADTARINCHEKLGDIARKHDRLDVAREHWEKALEIARRVHPGEAGVQRLDDKLARIAHPGNENEP